MFSATISKQLNAVFYLYDIDKPCPLVWEETMSFVRYACCNSQFLLMHLSSSQTNDWWFWCGNETTLCACIQIKSILRNRQQSGSPMNSF